MSYAENEAMFVGDIVTVRASDDLITDMVCALVKDGGTWSIFTTRTCRPLSGWTGWKRIDGTPLCAEMTLVRLEATGQNEILPVQVGEIVSRCGWSRNEGRTLLRWEGDRAILTDGQYEMNCIGYAVHPDRIRRMCKWLDDVRGLDAEKVA